ncbi:DUF6677 family protein [Geobacillus icigianus]|uniref:DUF6677 family protein n=1 Tax=Geobacillus icigianus TaxID=1430331 RepID=UPI003CFF9A48
MFIPGWRANRAAHGTFPGLGHLYLGRVLKGLFFVIVNIVSILFTGNILGILVFLLNWIFSILDSIKTTKVINSTV